VLFFDDYHHQMMQMWLVCQSPSVVFRALAVLVWAQEFPVWMIWQRVKDAEVI
jgi:hypothetical protein